MANANEIKECPDCGSINIIHGKMRDQIICRDCGLIFEPAIPIEIKPGEAAALAKPAKSAKKGAAKKAKPKKKAGALKKLFKKLTKKRK